MITKADLQAQADEAGLEVTRADGKEGEPTKADYQAALEAEGLLEAEPDPADQADYRILVAAGPMSGMEGTITMDRSEGDGWVSLGWLEPVNVE